MFKKLGFGSGKDSKDKVKPTAPATSTLPTSPVPPAGSYSNGHAASAAATPSMSSAPMPVPGKALPKPPAQSKVAAALPVAPVPVTSSTQSLEEQLIAATIAGDLGTVSSLMSTNVNKNCKDEAAFSIYMIAANLNHVHLLELFYPFVQKGLIEQGDMKINILDCTLAHDSLEALQWLVEKNCADVNCIHQYVLDSAANLGAKRVLDYLRLKITNPALKVPTARVLLPHADELYATICICSAGIPEVERLISLGTDVHHAFYGPNAAPPVHYSAIHRKYGIAQYLITEQRCDPNVTDAAGENLIFAAACSGNLTLLRWCKQYPNIDPNLRNRDGMTPLAAAARAGHFDAVKCLVGEFGVVIEKNFTMDDARAVKAAGYQSIFDYILTTGKAQRAAGSAAATSNVVGNQPYRSPVSPPNGHLPTHSTSSVPPSNGATPQFTRVNA